MNCTENHKSGRTVPLTIAVLLLALLLPGCGSNRVIINLDLDSFIAEEERSFPYLLLPLEDDWEDRSEIEEMETPDGLREIVILEAMKLGITVVFDNNLVIGDIQMSFTLDVYVAGHDSVEIFWSEQNRLLSLGGTLGGGEVTTIEDEVDVADFLELFQNHDLVYVGLAMHLTRESGLGLIQGDAVVTRMHMQIVARENLF